MYARMKKIVAVLVFCAMAAGLVSPCGQGTLQAAAAPKLSKKIVVIQKGKSVKVKLKNGAKAKKVKWSVKNKKVASIKAKKMTVTIKAVKSGSTNVVCRFKYNGRTKKLICKVKVVTKLSLPETDEDEEENEDGENPEDKANLPASEKPGNDNKTPEPPASSDIQQPNVTPGVTEGTDPTENPNPTNDPDQTGTPGQTENPGQTGLPNPTGNPGLTGSPNPTGNPTQTGVPNPTGNPTQTPEPAAEGVLLDNDFSDGSTGGFKGRGSASVKSVVNEEIAAIPVLSVTGRSDKWHGAEIPASGMLEAGKIYSVSTAVYQDVVGSTEIYMTLSYKDSSGNTQYQRISSSTVSKGKWSGIKADIAVPEGATDFTLYFEENGTNSFYVAPVRLFDKDSYDKTIEDDFEDGSLSNYNARTSSLEAADGGVIGKCMRITGRTASWNGVSAALAINPGASVYVSGYVKTEAAGCTFKASAQATDISGEAAYPNLGKTELNAGEWTKFSYVKTFDKESYMSMDNVYFEMEGTDTEGKYPDFYLDNVSICVVDGESDMSDINADSTYDITGSLLESYGTFFGNVGTCMNLSQLNGTNTFEFAKSQYNSITAENEMKPDSLLNSGTISLSEAKNNKYYYIPENYTESTCPKINYSNVDKYMEKAYQNGMRIRFHVFVWHQQTPKWFFKEGYNANGNWVTAETMNARLELYIKSVIKYISEKEKELGYGDVVYCYDVVNEYFNNNNNKENGVSYKAYWDEVYYPEHEFDVNDSESYVQTTEPVYVKNAFTYAREILDSYNKQNVTLFYNDFNTYMGDHPDRIIKMMEYINSERKLCDGIGMQSHLDVTYPTPATYTDALKKFLASDYIYEVQITELDVTINEEQKKLLDSQMTYYYNLMKAILNVQKASPNKKITGLTFWGLYDSVSWRASRKPLLFASTSKAKGVYFKVLQAAEEMK